MSEQEELNAPSRPPPPQSELKMVIIAPFIDAVERYAARRRAHVVESRQLKYNRNMHGPPLEIVNPDGSITRVLSVTPIGEEPISHYA